MMKRKEITFTKKNIVQFLIFISSIICVINAQASTILVTNLNDSGTGSLREAILVSLNADNIDLSSLSGTIILNSGQININNKDLTIIGNNVANLIIDCNYSSRAFRINNSSVFIKNIQIINGKTNDGFGGGAISSIYGSDLTIENCFIKNCETSEGFTSRGGAIDVLTYDPITWDENGATSLTISYSKIENCRAFIGGAVRFSGNTQNYSIIIHNSTFKNNSTGAYGSLISGNDGGALELVPKHNDIPSGGVVNITNCTFSGNKTMGPGNASVGGVFSLGTGVYEINSCTFSENSSNTTGGAIEFWGLNGTCTISNSLFANNNANTGNDNVYGNFISGGYNLFDNNCIPYGFNLGTDINNVNPQLLVLGNYGGGNETYAISCGSAAIDAGGGSIPLLDQRDLPRKCIPDIGAFEYQTICNCLPNYSSSTENVTCPGGSNGSATVAMNPIVGSISYNWYDAGGQNSQTIDSLTQGTYHCIITSSEGFQDTIEVIVSENIEMYALVINTDNACINVNNGSMSIEVTGGVPNYQYQWSNSLSITNNANDLPSGLTTVTIIDSNGCSIQISQTIGELDSLQFQYLSTDQFICQNDSLLLVSIVSGGNSPYSFTWLNDNEAIGNTSSITIKPEDSVEIYCLQVNDNCGSPQLDSCIKIKIYDPITPLFVLDTSVLCEPAKFMFYNNSLHQELISSFVIDFGDNSKDSIVGQNYISHLYNDPGYYSASIEIFTFEGCKYSESFENIVNVLEKPISDFEIYPNPTTIFNTTFSCTDKSTNSILWEWNSDNFLPSNSNTQNQVFQLSEVDVGFYPISLLVNNEYGCTDSITKFLEVVSDISFFAPNSFTPDDNTFNQTWKFFGNGIKANKFELTIYNRWGEQIWQTHDINAEWNGIYKNEKLPIGTYNWVAILEDKYTDYTKVIRGNINLIR